MKRLLLFNQLVLVLMLFLCAHAQAQTLSFPEAEGFGRFAKGARGVANRQVYIVTNLNDAGPGSFRDAVSVPGRIVVFSVGGIINLISEVLVSPNVTIAGQTAPGEGIVLYGKRVTFTGSNNTIARYLRIRLGSTNNSGKDASGLANGSNMMFDHMSFSWGMDEVFSINWDNKGKAPDSISIQNSIIAQGLHRDNHSCGGLIQTPDGGKVSLIKNLYISNKTRNPKVKGVNEFVNNVVYNYGNGNRLGSIPNYGWSGEGYIMGGSAGISEVNIINNYFVGGPLTPPADVTPFSRGTGTFNIFGSGNYFDNNKNGMLDGALVPYDTMGYPGIIAAGFKTLPFPYPAASPTLTADQAYQYVIDNVGVSYPRRDQVDSLLIDEVMSRGTKGFYVYRETDLPFSNGGVGLVFGAPAPLDSDADGMPDAWEDANGLNKNDSQDAIIFSALHPLYLNIEVYINSITSTSPPDFIKAPVIVSLTATSFESPVSNSKVVVRWSDKSDNEDNFTLERSPDGNAYTVIATPPSNSTSYTDEGLLPNQTYFYRLKAVAATDASVYSLAVSVKTPTIPSAPALPNTPSPANQARNIDFSNVTLKWVGSSNTVSYKIYFGSDPLNLAFLSDATTASLVIHGLSESITYYWRVDALNSLGTTTGDTWSFTTAKVFPPEIVGDWRLDATSDIVVADSSIYLNDGEITNITDFAWEPGKINNALTINTIIPTSSIVIDHGEQLFFNTNSFSFSLWVKAPAQTAASYLFHKGTFARNAATGATGKWFGLELKSGNIRFAVDDDVTKSEVSVSHATFFTNNWVHVVVVRDVAVKKLRIYRNGVLMVEGNDNTLGGIGQEDPLVIANTNDFNVPFKGMLDELKAFNYALTETQVLELLQTTPLPLQALAPSPVNGSQVDALNTVKVSWKGGVNSTVYKLYVGLESDSLAYVTDVPLNDPSYTFNDLTAGTTYYWRVDAVGSLGTTTGEAWSFKTAFPIGLVGHWKFDETSGLAANDNSPYHHVATLTNLTETGWSTDAKFGQSFQFKTPTSTSAITIPHADHLLFDANSFTISMWVKIPANTYTSATNGDTYLISKGTFEATTGKWYGLQLRNGVLTFAIDDGITKTNIDVTVTSAANNIFTNQWKHIIAIKDIAARQIKIYIDGILVGSKAYNTLTIGRLTPINLGNSTENKPYRDLMDDVRLYNYALSVSEIQSLFNGIPLVPKATNPIPANNATVNDPQHVNLTWSGNAHSYALFFGASADNLTPIATDLHTPAFALSNLADHTQYFWRVNAIRDGETAVGDVWSFTTFDTVPPVALAKNITVQLDSSGNVTVDPAAVDNGSSDAYGIASLSLSKSTFDCSNIGLNSTTFTVTDNNGNASSVLDTIMVEDRIAPVVITRNITIQLDGNGQAVITPILLDNGSFDACGIESYALDKTIFDCSMVGSTTVSLIITDKNGNSSTGTAIVTVEDHVAPVVITRNIIVELNTNGTATITAAQLDNGSTDACGINSLSLNKISFSCSDVGANTVILTATDKNGNSNSATATVIVADKVAPVALVKNVSVTLVNGVATVTAAMINNGSYDVCGPVTLSISKGSFNCSDIGINHVVLTVIDASGNASTGRAIVFVKGIVSSPYIFVTRRDHTPTGADANTIFLGYGAQSLRLTAFALGATSYSWSPAAGLNNASIYNPMFTATHAGDFKFTVTATNKFGCQATASVTIHVIDARCGNALKKMVMCRRGNEVCVSKNSVDEYLDRGYKIGNCTDDSDSHTGPDHGHHAKLAIYPNPVSSRSRVEFTVHSGVYKLELYDLYGRFVETLTTGRAEGTESLTHELHAHRYTGNVYLIRLITTKGVETERVVIQP